MKTEYKCEQCKRRFNTAEKALKCEARDKERKKEVIAQDKARQKLLESEKKRLNFRAIEHNSCLNCRYRMDYWNCSKMKPFGKEMLTVCETNCICDEWEINQ